MAYIVQTMQSIQYDGTNGDDISELAPNTGIVSDNGTSIVFDGGDNADTTANVGDWMIIVNGYVSEVDTNTQYLSKWHELAS